MKPKIICTDCGNELKWGDRYCGACGKAVEWPDREGRSAVRQPSQAQEGRKSRARRSVAMFQSWKLVLAIVVGVIGAAVVVEYFTGSSRAPSVSQPASSSEASANIAALPQIEAMEQQLSQDPKNDRLRLQLANLLQDNKFYDKAITQYKEYLKNNPNDADARVDLGICYNDQGNLEAAKKEMKAAIERNPKHALGYFNLGIVTLQQGDLQEANQYFRKTIELAPNSSVADRAKQLLEQHANIPNPQPN